MYRKTQGVRKQCEDNGHGSEVCWLITFWMTCQQRIDLDVCAAADVVVVVVIYKEII